MEPRTPNIPSPGNTSPERSPAPLTPESSPPSSGGEQAGEWLPSREQINDQGAVNAAPVLPPPALPLPVDLAAANDASAKTNDSPANDNPLAADDVDVIEKEWVDRAKKIIAQTKNDPYQQEHEVSKLQADYLEKRFGVQVKLPQG